MKTQVAWVLCALALVAASCGSPEDTAVNPAPAAATVPDASAGVPQDEALERELATLRVAVDLDPRDAAAQQALGRALYGAKRAQQALEPFERAVELDPAPRHLMDLALAYGAVSRLAEAQATYERLLELVPGDPTVVHNLANIATKRGDRERAIELQRQAIAARPDYLLAHYHLAQALEKTERYEEAYRTYERVLTLEPASAEDLVAFDNALYGLGALDLKMGDYPRAARLLAELIQANPTHPNAYYAYGQALLRLGRVAEAQRALDKHIEILAQQEPQGPVATGD